MADLIAVLTAVLALLLLLSGYASWRASRLDRLHLRVEGAAAALDAALARRAAAALELAAAPGLDPEAAARLGDAAAAPLRITDRRERELAESALSRVLRATAAAPGAPAGPRAEAEAAATRVYLARRFYNDAVATTREARAGRLVRALRLAGRAPLPDFFEMDDRPPESAGPAR